MTTPIIDTSGSVVYDGALEDPGSPVQRMLNLAARREAIEALVEALARCEGARARAVAGIDSLSMRRARAANVVVVMVEAYLSALADSPKEFEKTVADFRAQANEFTAHVEEFNIRADLSIKAAGVAGGAGALAGVGVAALGPSAALAIATTFGTGSTGTAISALSGGAATNAALAWLGGGAIAAGGGGMAAGSALLALAGPVGLSLAGLALAGSAFYLHKTNRKVAEEATERRLEVEAEIRTLEIAAKSVESLAEQTAMYIAGVLRELTWLAEHAPYVYCEFEEGHKERLQLLVNQVQSLSALLRKEVSIE